MLFEPIQRSARISVATEGMGPFDKLVDELVGFYDFATSSCHADINPIEVSEFIRNFWSFPAKIDELVANKDSIDPSISRYVILIGRAISIAMVRIDLIPESVGILLVDIISARVHPASSERWSLICESLVIPKFLECQCF